MKGRDAVIDALGAAIVLSVLYHSREGTLALVVILPVVMVSLGRRMEDKRIQLVGLGAVSLLVPYFVSSHSMGELFPLIIFIITLVTPLVAYWGLTLSCVVVPEPVATIGSIVYTIMVLLTFYIFTLFFRIGEYILDPGNMAPQALMLIALSLLVLMPYYIYVELRHP